MPDEQSAPEGTGYNQPGWQVNTVNQNVYNITQSGEKAPPDNQSRPYFTVPFLRNADFVGRDADLETLHAALAGDGEAENRPVGILPAGLTGQGGMGKTALAVEYCYRHSDDYPGGVFWVNAAEPLAQGFAALGCLIDPANFDRPVPRQIDAAARYLNSHPDALLVLDNVEDPATLTRPVATGRIPTQLACRLLFTTRRRDLPRNCRPVEVTVLPPDAALSLLLSQRGGVDGVADPERAVAAHICAILGHLPLALEIAAAHLRRPQLALTRYRDALLERGALAVVDDPAGRVRADDLTTRHAAAVAATLAEQWASLDSEDACLLLRVAGQLPEAAQIPVARLGLLAGISDEDDLFGSPLEVAMSELERASLVEELSGDTLRLHPLVREFAAGRTTAAERDNFRRDCAARLLAAYGDVARLEGQCAQRGIHALEADLTSAVDLLSPTVSSHTELRDQLYRLRQILERESHVLRGWEATQHPAFFAQQLCYRAIVGYHQEQMIVAKDRLAELGQRYLLLVWCTNRITRCMIRTLWGHESGVTAVVAMPNGKRVISASNDFTLRIWNLDSGIEEQVLKGHTSNVRSVAVTSDGSLIVSASNDQTLRIWSLDGSATVRVLNGHENWVVSVAVTSDGRWAVSTSVDRTVRVWDLGNGIQKRILTGHEDAVNAVVTTPDNKRVISASDDRTVRVWDLESGSQIQVLTGHERPVSALAMMPDGRRVVSASEDGTLRVWNLKIGSEERVWTGHKDIITAITVTPDGKKLISVSRDQTIRVWDLSSLSDISLESQKVMILTTDANWPQSVAVTPDGKKVVTASSHWTLHVWDFSKLFDKSAGTWVYKQIPRIGHDNWVNGAIITPDGARLVSVSSDRTLRIWDLENGTEERVLSGHEASVLSVAVTPDGRRAVSASDDRTLRVWDLNTGAEERVLSGHEASVLSVAVTPDGRRAVSASFDRTLRVWDLETGAEERVLRGHEDRVRSVAVTLDGRRAVSASSDRTLRVWDLNTGAEERVLSGHESLVRSVAVTPDGSRAVSASDDRTLRVWDLETGEELARIVLDGAVTAVAVAPNGTTIVAGDAGGNVYCLEYVEGKGEALTTP